MPGAEERIKAAERLFDDPVEATVASSRTRRTICRGCRGMWVLTDEANVAANRVYAGAGGVREQDQVVFQWGDT